MIEASLITECHDHLIEPHNHSTYFGTRSLTEIMETEKIDLITQISLDINEVKDLDILLERILTRVRKFFNADAGSIYLKEADKLKFSHTQNVFHSHQQQVYCRLCGKKLPDCKHL
jgi:transcriptional regulator with GAF, ATPase, and Fis domain